MSCVVITGIVASSMCSMCSTPWACTLLPSSAFLFIWVTDSELLLICYQSRCHIKLQVIRARRFLIICDVLKLFLSSFDVAVTVSPWCLPPSEDDQVGMFSSICYPFFGASPSICFFFHNVFPPLWYFFNIVFCHFWHIFLWLHKTNVFGSTVQALYIQLYYQDYMFFSV